MSILGNSIYLPLLTVFFAVTVAANGCQRDADSKDEESSSDSDSQSDDDDDSEGNDEEGSDQGEDENESEESEPLPKLPKPKACKRYAPKVAFPDTNPSSDTYKEEVSTKDTKGEVALWIPTFDCDC